MKRLLSILLIWMLSCGFGEGWKKPTKGTSLNKSHPLSQELMYAWVINEKSGNLLFDSSKNVTNYSNTSIPISPEGRQFDGLGIKYFDGGSGMRYQNFSVYAIAKSLGNAGSTYGAVIGNTNTGAGDFGWLLLRLNASSKFTWNCSSGGWTSLSADRVTDNIKTSVTCIVRNKLMTMWLNNTEQSSKLTLAGDITYTNAVISIGNYARINNLEYNGIVYTIYIYKKPLLPSEIYQLNNNPYAMFDIPIFSQPYLNFGSSGAPPVVPTRRQRSYIQISWWDEMMRNLGIG